MTGWFTIGLIWWVCILLAWLDHGKTFFLCLLCHYWVQSSRLPSVVFIEIEAVDPGSSKFPLRNQTLLCWDFLHIQPVAFLLQFSILCLRSLCLVLDIRFFSGPAYLVFYILLVSMRVYFPSFFVGWGSSMTLLMIWSMSLTEILFFIWYEDLFFWWRTQFLHVPIVCFSCVCWVV